MCVRLLRRWIRSGAGLSAQFGGQTMAVGIGFNGTFPPCPGRIAHAPPLCLACHEERAVRTARRRRFSEHGGEASAVGTLRTTAQSRILFRTRRLPDDFADTDLPD